MAVLRRRRLAATERLAGLCAHGAGHHGGMRRGSRRLKLPIKALPSNEAAATVRRCGGGARARARLVPHAAAHDVARSEKRAQRGLERDPPLQRGGQTRRRSASSWVERQHVLRNPRRAVRDPRPRRGRS